MLSSKQAPPPLPTGFGQALALLSLYNFNELLSYCYQCPPSPPPLGLCVIRGCWMPIFLPASEINTKENGMVRANANVPLGAKSFSSPCLLFTSFRIAPWANIELPRGLSGRWGREQRWRAVVLLDMDCDPFWRNGIRRTMRSAFNYRQLLIGW